MIAKNFLKYPEALRFQRELFHNGFKNSPRIMRLMECVFNFAPTTPQWAKDLARKARNLVKSWKAAQIAVNFNTVDPLQTGARLLADQFIGYFSETGKTWTGRGKPPAWFGEAAINRTLWKTDGQRFFNTNEGAKT